MRRFIALENIAHFKRQLETETDPKRRGMIQQLLAQEEAQLVIDERKLSAPSKPPATSEA